MFYAINNRTREVKGYEEKAEIGCSQLIIT